MDRCLRRFDTQHSAGRRWLESLQWYSQCCMDSSSLVNVVSQGRSAENQTDSWVCNTETVTFPHHSLTESSSKCVNHNNLMLISSVSGEMSQQTASVKLLPNYQNNELKMSKRNHPIWCSNNILLMRQRDNIFNFTEHQKFIRIQSEFIMRLSSLSHVLKHFVVKQRNDKTLLCH